jgi:hypothetical protein
MTMAYDRSSLIKLGTSWTRGGLQEVLDKVMIGAVVEYNNINDAQNIKTEQSS